MWKNIRNFSFFSLIFYIFHNFFFVCCCIFSTHFFFISYYHESWITLHHHYHQFDYAFWYPRYVTPLNCDAGKHESCFYTVCLSLSLTHSCVWITGLLTEKKFYFCWFLRDFFFKLRNHRRTFRGNFYDIK